VKRVPPTLQASPDFEKIVMRCLEKAPADRYQKMSELKAALEKAVKPKVTVSSEEPQPSIAVLPFVNMSGDTEQEYFSDGLAEEIINALTKIPGLQVTARTSAFVFKGKVQDITEIAKALRVSNILEGSVRKSGNRIRVTAQLIEASKGVHLWSERYDREMEDIFAIQDEISQSIAEKLKAHLSGDRQLVKHPTGDIEAYNLYLRGRYHFLKGTPDGWAKSKECYEQALAIDPTCALAWYGLAFYYHLLESAGFIPSGEAHKQSRYAVLKSLKYDETLPEAHSLMGEQLAREFDWNNAEREFHRALELNSKSADILFGYSYFYLLPMQCFDKALELSKKASEQDPLSAFCQWNLGVVYFLTRQYAQAIKQLNNALELDPQLSIAYMWLCKAYFENGDDEECFQILKKLPNMFTNTHILMPLGFIGYIYVKMGHREEAKKILAKLQNFSQQTHEHVISFALINFGFGEVEKGFDRLDRAAQDHQSFLLIFINHPFLDPLRSHPRYKALLRKMNLEH
jgi:TolB-like protein/Tfp pilus assembly protein PilF